MPDFFVSRYQPIQKCTFHLGLSQEKLTDTRSLHTVFKRELERMPSTPAWTDCSMSWWWQTLRMSLMSKDNFMSSWNTAKQNTLGWAKLLGGSIHGGKVLQAQGSHVLEPLCKKHDVLLLWIPESVPKEQQQQSNSNNYNLVPSPSSLGTQGQTVNTVLLQQKMISSYIKKDLKQRDRRGMWVIKEQVFSANENVLKPTGKSSTLVQFESKTPPKDKQTRFEIWNYLTAIVEWVLINLRIRRALLDETCDI